MQEIKGPEKIALFVDIENFIGFSNDLRLPVDLAPVIKKLTETGKVLFRRSFGDLTQSLYATNQGNRLQHVRHMLQRNLVQHEDVPYDSKYKNSSDIRLAVEALSTAFGFPDITAFAIVSSDRDYIPLFSKLRELGKDVTGISGNPTTISDRYITACDTIFYVEDLYKVESGVLAESADKSDVPILESELYIREQYLNLLVQAVSLLSEQGKKTVGAAIVPKIRQMQPDFDVNRAGFSSFKKFVAFAKERGLVMSAPHGMDVAVTLPSLSAVEVSSNSPIEEPGLDLTERYRRFIEGKRRQPLPSRDLRRRIYESASEVLNNNDEPAISLNDLSHGVKDKLLSAGLPITQPAVFKLLYSLHRADCFTVETGRDSYDPQILGIKHKIELWDERFIDSALTLMGKEMRDTPFVANKLSLLFYEDEENVQSIASKLDNLRIEYTKANRPTLAIV